MPEVVDVYDRLLAGYPELERKGKKTPYTSVNGHMFSFVTTEGELALRLPRDERAAFLERHPDAICAQHGVVMKEYVTVPDGMLSRTKALKELFEQSFAYVRSKKPKPTTRKRVKKATSKKKKKKKKAPTKKKPSKKKAPTKKAPTKKAPTEKKRTRKKAPGKKRAPGKRKAPTKRKAPAKAPRKPRS
jgi:hypothetical protein